MRNLFTEFVSLGRIQLPFVHFHIIIMFGKGGERLRHDHVT